MPTTTFLLQHSPPLTPFPAWGQHRISKDSFSGKVSLYYNMVMCGTPNKCRAFFADAESGLVSRVTPVVLPDMVGARMPEFNVWTKDEAERVKRQCLCLMDEEGEVDLPCPSSTKPSIAYLLEGRRETERAIKFAIWFAERCLYYQLLLYGDKIDALNKKAGCYEASGFFV